MYKSILLSILLWFLYHLLHIDKLLYHNYLLKSSATSPQTWQDKRLHILYNLFTMIYFYIHIIPNTSIPCSSQIEAIWFIDFYDSPRNHNCHQIISAGAYQTTFFFASRQDFQGSRDHTLSQILPSSWLFLKIYSTDHNIKPLKTIPLPNLAPHTISFQP